MTLRGRGWVMCWLVIAGVCLAPRARALADTGSPTEMPRTLATRARELFMEGSAFYQAAQYDAAIERFEAAYRLSALPDLLFNIAQAYRLKGPPFCATALRYYERHLHEQPAASNQAEIEELMTEMRRCAALAPAPTAPAPAVPAPTAPALAAPGLASATMATETAPSAPAQAAPTPMGPAPVAKLDATNGIAPAPILAGPDRMPPAATWPGWTMRAGAGLALVGLVAYGAGRIKYNAVKDSCPCEPGSFQNWERVTTGSYAFMAAGGAVLAAGLVSHYLVGRAGLARRGTVLLFAPVSLPRPDQRPGLGGAMFSLRLLR